MKKTLKWIGIILGCLLVVGFLLFLYFIPPFPSMSAQDIIEPELAAGPDLKGIADPRERLMAEHGKYIVLTRDCSGCHTSGASGPDYSKYLAGGAKTIIPGFGTAVCLNLTSDSQTGLGNHTDEEILTALRSGLKNTGELMHHRFMPWDVWSNWTEEDRRAVVVYLRHLKPVRHKIPDFVPASPADSGSAEVFYGGDYSVKE
jgi:mono/diheme cytochrome c family protein